jgi:hypothetical protein
MVDPTWKENCPACGTKVDVNQLGQVYGHSGVNGCPYSGTSDLARQGIYPLKFDYRPVITAAAAYVDDCDGATIRYELEYDPKIGEYISLRTADGDVFGIAEITNVFEGELREVFKLVKRAKARYTFSKSSDLKEAMNGYYGEEIDYDTRVVGLTYSPWIANCYKDGPAIKDGV